MHGCCDTNLSVIPRQWDPALGPRFAGMTVLPCYLMRRTAMRVGVPTLRRSRRSSHR